MDIAFCPKPHCGTVLRFLTDGLGRVFTVCDGCANPQLRSARSKPVASIAKQTDAARCRDYYQHHREERLAYAAKYRESNRAAINKAAAEKRRREREALGALICLGCNAVPIPRRASKGGRQFYCFECARKRRKRLNKAARVRYEARKNPATAGTIRVTLTSRYRRAA